jgi:hypothetical protein
MKNERALSAVESPEVSASNSDVPHDGHANQYELSEDEWADYEPPVGSMPRLYRGIVWSDVVAEIYAEREERREAA